MAQWEPTLEQVQACQAEMIKAATLQAKPTTTPSHTTPSHTTPSHTTPDHATPNHPESPSPPAVLPEGAQWYRSWQEFFHNRDESHSKRLEGASDEDKKIWESRAINAKKFHPPGRKSGAKVFIWEECDTGGYLWILKSCHDAAEDWEYYFKEALVFSPQDNIWDHCPFKWKPAVEGGAPDDTDSNDGYVDEHWYAEPDLPTTPPDNNPSSLVLGACYDLF